MRTLYSIEAMTMTAFQAEVPLIRYVSDIDPNPNLCNLTKQMMTQMADSFSKTVTNVMQFHRISLLHRISHLILCSSFTQISTAFHSSGLVLIIIPLGLSFHFFTCRNYKRSLLVVYCCYYYKYSPALLIQ